MVMMSLTLSTLPSTLHFGSLMTNGRGGLTGGPLVEDGSMVQSTLDESGLKTKPIPYLPYSAIEKVNQTILVIHLSIDSYHVKM